MSELAPGRFPLQLLNGTKTRSLASPFLALEYLRLKTVPHSRDHASLDSCTPFALICVLISPD